MREADALDAPQAATPSPGVLTAVAFVAPWLLVALALPAAWRWKGLVLLAFLCLLLVLAAAVAERMAIDRHLDPSWWAFVAVVSFGLALAPLCFWKPGVRMPKLTYLCRDCGRLGELNEPFCFGCGTTA